MSKSFTTRFVAALTARNNEVPSADTATAIGNAERSAVGLDAVMSLPEFKEIANELIKRARIADPKNDKLNYIAVKVLVKIISTLQAIATKLPADLDPYTRTIGANLCKLNGISNKSALVCLSKSVEYDALDQSQSLTRRYNCSANTAGTQSSSTRMCLKYLGIADVQKGKRGDVTTLSDNERAKQFVAVFSDRHIAEEQEPAAQE
jgi:hypothetical protein